MIRAASLAAVLFVGLGHVGIGPARHLLERTPLPDPVPATPTHSATAGDPSRLQLALEFEENVGQIAEPGGFLARGPGYAVLVSGSGLRTRLLRHLTEGFRATATVTDVRTTLVGASGSSRGQGLDARPGLGHYYIGGDPAGWRSGVARFGRVRYAGVYPGVDVEYYGRDGRIEYDFVVTAGADPAAIRLRFDGADEVGIDAAGDLVLHTAAGAIRQARPLAYQEADSGRRVIDSRYVLHGDGSVGFELGAYDRSRRLVIDPVLLYSTYLGGSLADNGADIAVDGAGNIYVTGRTLSPNFPTSNAAQGVRAGVTDVFVAKLGPFGANLLYATYLGGTEAGQEQGFGIAVDSSGTAYVTGVTDAPDFPMTAGGVQPVKGAGSDGFVARLSSTGTLESATYLGGGDTDQGTSIAVDGSGVYIAGETMSSDFVTTAGVVQPAIRTAGMSDFFVAKLAPTLASRIFATYLGGSQFENTPDVAVDASGGVYLTGTTFSADFPTQSPFQAAKGVDTDGVVVKLNGAATAIVYASFLGGDQDDFGHAIAVDGLGQAVAVGVTQAQNNFPLLNPFQAAHAGASGTLDAYVTKVGPTGALLFSTYLGGAGDEDNVSMGVAVDAQGNVTVAGTTRSTNFPIPAGTPTPFQATLAGGSDAFVVRFSGTGSLLYSTYLGGTGGDNASGVALDGFGRAHVSGSAATGFPTVEALQNAHGGGFSDAFVAIVSVVTATDSDGDGLPDSWETMFGLDPNSAAFENGAGGDPDGDGETNQQEFQNGGHPTGDNVAYFAEGATSGFFDTRFALLNPSTTTTALVQYRFLKTDGTTGSFYVALNPSTRHTLDAKTVSGFGTAEFSTVIESNEQIVVDRLMEWDSTSGYGSHGETSVPGPALVWYLAEGSTNGFNLFYLVQNPNSAQASVEVTYLLPSGPPIVQTYSVNPRSRFNIWVNSEAGRIPQLANTDVSAVVRSTNGVRIIVERAMYLDAGGQTFAAGHESAGTLPALNWFLAEGATGSFFDLFVLIANPNATDAQVRADYLLPSGTVVQKFYTVKANSRFNIWVDLEDAQLADTAVSTTITSLNGVTIIVERAMWWPGPTAATWSEAHNSPGATDTGTLWALAEGEVGGSRNRQTYILIANTSAAIGSVKVTLVFDDGTTAERTFAVNGRSRFNVDVGAEFPSAVGRRFGAVVQSLGASPALIVVERAMYSDALGVVWAAGTNSLGTRLQ